eukprot:CAMPEP_0185174678 /NCGR_PEP_ID=MMETSP1139-20130426/25646_1 /TAXON_ID=298111 /ORGANISM="Pavlova sp., Strain CCMP459" /LENGTH=178 /DNA_ID=CAMNT_0027740399 /DNA_START=465 /DNA_END=998 /DNA_ORIENTATION=+
MSLKRPGEAKCAFLSAGDTPGSRGRRLGPEGLGHPAWGPGMSTCQAWDAMAQSSSLLGALGGGASEGADAPTTAPTALRAAAVMVGAAWAMAITGCTVAWAEASAAALSALEGRPLFFLATGCWTATPCTRVRAEAGVAMGWEGVACTTGCTAATGVTAAFFLAPLAGDGATGLAADG